MDLELVSDLTKDAFIVALRWFVSRRGKLANMYSDNGTAFLGSNNGLQSFGIVLDTERNSLSYSIENFGIFRNFIPANSSYFAGLLEAKVKSSKHHHKRVAGNSILTFKQFYTFNKCEIQLQLRTLDQNLNKGKLDARFKRGIFVDYSAESKAYGIRLPEER